MSIFESMVVMSIVQIFWRNTTAHGVSEKSAHGTQFRKDDLERVVLSRVVNEVQIAL